MITKPQNLRIAVQKSGRLNAPSMQLLEHCGIHFESVRNGALSLKGSGFPIDLFLIRDDNIPGFIRSGLCDAGIVGLDVLEETADTESDGDNAVILRPLGFGKCRLSIAVPTACGIVGPQDLNAKTIATSHPNILRRYLKRSGINAIVTELSGSVEIAPALGLADAICDLVSTGQTLMTNRLRELTTVLSSEAVLVCRNDLSPDQEQLLNRLLQRIDSSIRASRSRYIMMNAPKSSVDKIKEILPGMEHPSILNLSHDQEKVAIHTVADEPIFWSTLEQLKLAGASSILVVPIEKIID